MSDVPEAYRKSDDEERFLARLNETLAGFQEGLYQSLPETLPTLHVVGVPRSGTTLVSQLLCGHLDVGYISNFIAAFWRAPTVGVRLWRKLYSGSRPTSYESEFGRTRGPLEPHEFGYFWRELLGYSDLSELSPEQAALIDWTRVRTVLTNINAAFAAPTVYKSVTTIWHIADLYRALPRSCFVRVTRDAVDNALSLLQMRRLFVGNTSAWTSARPREYSWLKDRPVAEQLAGQVVCLDRAVERGIAQVPRSQVLECSYEAVCADPLDVLKRVGDLLNAQGAEVRVTSRPEERLHARAPKSGHDDRQLVASIEESLARWRAGLVRP